MILITTDVNNFLFGTRLGLFRGFVDDVKAIFLLFFDINMELCGYAARWIDYNYLKRGDWQRMEAVRFHLDQNGWRSFEDYIQQCTAIDMMK